MPCWRFQALYKIREPFTIYHFTVCNINALHLYRTPQFLFIHRNKWFYSWQFSARPFNTSQPTSSSVVKFILAHLTSSGRSRFAREDEVLDNIVSQIIPGFETFWLDLAFTLPGLGAVGGGGRLGLAFIDRLREWRVSTSDTSETQHQQTTQFTASLYM